MANHNIHSLLGSEAAQKIITDLGIHESDTRIQAELAAEAGEIIFKRMTLEILKKLPVSEHAQFDALCESVDEQALLDLVRTHIPDADAFIKGIAEKEVSDLKVEMAA
jgi:hypothetical protein